jgi:hypothetical protein
MNKYIDMLLVMGKSILFRAVVLALVLGIAELIRRALADDDSTRGVFLVAVAVALLGRLLEGAYDLYRAKERILHEADVPLASKAAVVKHS